MTMMSFPGWTARPERLEAVLANEPARGLAALLDQPAEAIKDNWPLPPLWHWIYFAPTAKQSELGPDGHPVRGGFLPPIDLPRRMFAGAELTFHRPLRSGRVAQREGEVIAISEKSGKTGRLVFVKVRYRFVQDGAVALEELQDIVYREAGGPIAARAVKPVAPPLPGAWGRTITPDPVLLFRFSALTFNSHRIHYDRPYATGVEHYPDLVVHGPLLALLLAELARANTHRPLRRFRFRALGPVFANHEFHLRGAEAHEAVVDLKVLGPDGVTCVEAAAQLAASA